MFIVMVIFGAISGIVLLTLDSKRRAKRVIYWRIAVTAAAAFLGAGLISGQEHFQLSTPQDAGDFLVKYLVAYFVGLAVLWFAFLQPEDIEAATCRRFRVAARDGDLESIRAMRKSKPDLVFSKDDHAGETPLHYAAAKGHKYVAEFLLSCKADANAKDSAGATPLHYAAAGGRVSVAELLLANKADVNATDGDGETPLHYAVASAHKDVAELLLASGADVDAKDKDGETPFQLAVPRDSLMS